MFDIFPVTLNPPEPGWYWDEVACAFIPGQSQWFAPRFQSLKPPQYHPVFDLNPSFKSKFTCDLVENISQAINLRLAFYKVMNICLDEMSEEQTEQFSSCIYALWPSYLIPQTQVWDHPKAVVNYAEDICTLSLYGALRSWTRSTYSESHVFIAVMFEQIVLLSF